MIVVHIGMPKAGSTTIQRFLAENFEALRRLSIDYPLIGREHVREGIKHGHIANEVHGSEDVREKNRGSLEQLADYLRLREYATTILSSEGFFRAPKRRIRQFRKILSNGGSQFRIVLVTRELMDAMPSAYAQKCKNGSKTEDFDAFLQKRLSHEELSVFSIAERWARVFGWDALCVRLLSPAALVGGDLITDFMGLCGLDEAGPEMASLTRPPRANESPGWKTTEAVRAFFGGRGGLAGDHPLMRDGMPTKKNERKAFASITEAVSAELGWNQDRGLYMTRAQAELCVRRYSSWIDSLNEHLTTKLPRTLSLEERGFVERPFLPDASRISPDELRQFYDRCGERWASR